MDIIQEAKNFIKTEIILTTQEKGDSLTMADIKKCLTEQIATLYIELSESGKMPFDSIYTFEMVIAKSIISDESFEGILNI